MADRTPASPRVLVAIVIGWVGAALALTTGTVTLVLLLLHAGGLGVRGVFELYAFAVAFGGFALTWQRWRRQELERRAKATAAAPPAKRVA